MLFLADVRAGEGQAACSATASPAVGSSDRDEADRVWKSIEADAPDLEALYEAGLRHQGNPCELDRRVRRTAVDAEGETIVALAFRRGATVMGEGEDDAAGFPRIER